MAETKNSGERRTALEEFLVEAETFVASTLDVIAASIGDSDDAPLIASHSGAAREQIGKLTQSVRAQYGRVNVELRRQVEEFMQTQSATTLARNGSAAIQQVAATGLFGEGIFSWIEANLQEIKKVIDWLANLLNLPISITKDEQLLDQIFKMILGLFAGVLGRNRSRVMSELSTMEVEFWNELASHRRFAMQVRSDQSDED